MFHATTLAFSPERNIITNLELRPDTPQSLVALPDESAWHVHLDDQEQAKSPQQHLLQAPKHQKPPQGVDRTHVDME